VTEQSVTMALNTPARVHTKRTSRFSSPQRREERQDAILAAAFEEFAAKGYAEARLDDVARRAGIAKGTIYLYFKNKELLFRAVLHGLIHQVFEELEVFVQTFPGSAEELVRNVLSRQYTQIVKNPKARSMFRLLISESHRFPQLSEVYLREVVTPGIRAMRMLVKKGVASGEFRDTKIAEFPQVLVGPAVLAVVWALILGERQQLDVAAYQEAHLELLLHGLRSTRAGAPNNYLREPASQAPGNSLGSR
jgi:AcrR family transcriptional regulator